MLAHRRIQQRNQMTGFTAMPNKRVNGAIQGRFAALVLDHADLVAKGLASGEPDVRALQERAVRDVAKTLRPTPGSKLFRYRPTRSDSAAYRNRHAWNQGEIGA